MEPRQGEATSKNVQTQETGNQQGTCDTRQPDTAIMFTWTEIALEPKWLRKMLELNKIAIWP